MWWTKVGNVVDGPFGDGEIRRRLDLGVLRSIDRISSDGKSWSYVKSSEFWTVSNCEVIGAKDGVQAKGRTSRLWFSRAVIGAGVVVVLLAGLAARRKNGPSSVSEEAAPVKFASVKCDSEPYDKVLLVHVKDGNGTAFFVDMDGKKYVLTNEHVVRSVSAPEMFLADGTKVSLGAMSIARDRDLVRFEVDFEGDCFSLDSAMPRHGDSVVVFGNSMGDGVITRLTGAVTGVGNRVVKVDAEFVPGNSGSPILSAAGKVIAVAAYLKNGSDGRDWTSKGTAFDAVRRFGIRLSNVDWIGISNVQYYKEVARIKLMETYWEYLLPYLICSDVSAERRKELLLVYRDIDKKRLDKDEAGFHARLMNLSKAYEDQTESWSQWAKLVEQRDDLIMTLNGAIREGRMSYANALMELESFDRKSRLENLWLDVKAKHREFNTQCNEALAAAKGFLMKTEWNNPLIQHGYGDDNRSGSVDWYLEGIQHFTDRNAQKLKDVNKVLKKLEQASARQEV